MPPPRDTHTEADTWAGKIVDGEAPSLAMEDELTGRPHGRVGLDEPARRAIAEVMNERMAEWGLTNRKLAALADIDITLISRLRNAQENPKLQTIMKLATALDLTLEEIGARERKIREAEKKPPSPRL